MTKPEPPPMQRVLAGSRILNALGGIVFVLIVPAIILAALHGEVIAIRPAELGSHSR